MLHSPEGSNFFCPLTVLFSTALLTAQEDNVMVMAEYMPSLTGCETKKDRNDRRSCTKEKIAAHIAETTRIPKEAVEAGADGTAVIEVVVYADGSVSDLVLVEDPGYGMGEVAMKSIKKLNKQWKPGEHFGEQVSVRMKIPVPFVLPEVEVEEAPVAAPDVYRVVDVMPAYEGCGTQSDPKNCTFTKVMAYMTENLKYPAEAKSANVEGTTRAKFVVGIDGSISDVAVVDGLGHGCDEEVVRLISQMPNWSPGVQDGKAVKVEMELPVTFKLPKE